MIITFKMEGLTETVANLGELPKATRRNVVSRVLKKAAEPIAEQMSNLAPHLTGKLGFSIGVSPTLTRRHKGEKINEVEMHIGPAAGLGTLFYASAVEFGTINTAAQPFARPAWENKKFVAYDIIRTELGNEVERAAARLARKTARLG